MRKKLKSRKWWLGLSSSVTGVIVLLANQATANKVAGLILAVGGVVAYILGESYVDAAKKGEDAK